MEKLSTKQIQQIAKQMIISAPGGIRWMQILKAIAAQSPDTPPNTIHGAVHALLKRDADIIKVARGTYLFSGNINTEDAAPSEEDIITVQTPSGSSTLKEDEFYEPFAEWLREELEEVNYVLPLGGNVFKGKWGTPDVLGVLRPQSFNLIKYEPQIVSAELQIDPAAPIVGFGQTVAYRLFSHKSYPTRHKGC